MKLPPNMTQDQVLAAIEKAVNILAPSFVFGFYDVADIKQEARMFGIQCLDKYDCKRPLENFVYSHIKNRLINFKRDKFKRNDPPCELCHTASGAGIRPKHDDGEFCAKYVAWKNRNAAKANIMRPLDLDYIADESEANTRLPSEAETTVETAELLQKIDEQLDIELRATYLQMRAGQSVPKAKRLVVEEAVKEILRGALECPSEED